MTEGLFLHHANKISKAEQKLFTARADHQNARKAAKGDGIDLKALDRARKRAKRDEHELIEEHNTDVLYSRWLGIPFWRQAELFRAEEITEEVVLERAYNDGMRVGKLGGDESDNPHDASLPAGRSWLDGYRDGQAKLMEGFKQL
jgi:uncharacterized protein (UPF0335 family)/ribosome modulation factor